MVIKNNGNHRGWAVLGTGASLLILLIVAVWAFSIYDDYIQQREWQVTAVQTSRFVSAVKSYIGTYYDTLLTSAGTTTPALVTPTMLKNTGFLETGFSATTAEGHQFIAAVTRNATNTNQLQALVITQGGTALSYKALRDISVDIDGMGGYVWNSTNVTGAMGSWTVPLASFGVSTTSGHIAALLTTDELGASRDESDRLYRYSVTGKPDLNRMHTDIDMGGDNLNNTNAVNAQTGNFSGNISASNVNAGNVNASNVAASNAVTAGGAMAAGGGITAGSDIRSTGGWLITRNSTGWENETYGGGFYMSDTDWVRAINDKNIYTAGQVRGGTVRSDGRLTVEEYIELDAQASAGSACNPIGLLVRDGVGALLSCQNYVWAYVGKNNGNYINLGTFTYQYNGYNGGQNTLLVNVWGGTSTNSKGVQDGACSNTWALAAYVNGLTVANAVDNNVDWAKSGFISFPVPSGASYSVVSNPLPDQGCSPGVFSLVGYQ